MVDQQVRCVPWVCNRRDRGRLQCLRFPAGVLQTILSPLAAKCWPKQRCFGNNGQQLGPSNRRTEPSLRPTPPDRLYGDGDLSEELLRAALCCQN